MWIDYFILAPVLVFLLWLYWYSRPATGLSRLDRLILILVPVLASATLWILHIGLDVEGMALNVIAVAAAYLLACGILGAGWMARGLRNG